MWMNGDPKLILCLPIERQFAKSYTRKQFFKFQRELVGLIQLRYVVEQCGSAKSYMVRDGHMKYKVDFQSDNCTYVCECHLFETDGIICRHGLLVFREEEVQIAPDKYVLDRWSKECKRSHLNAKAVAVEVKERRESYNNLYSSLHPIFLDLIEYALLDEDGQQCVVDGLNSLRMVVSKSREKEVVNNGVAHSVSASSVNNMDVEDVVQEVNEAAVKDPLKKRKRGRPPTKRLKSVVEKFAIKQIKRIKVLLRKRDVK